ncbi:MAG: hypothetical protein QGH15_05025 [Kiritimatiellia bacterium]|jgi:hypothetical protein|nr:hypothetical protein [Kiritimatiellia bacterium]
MSERATESVGQSTAEEQFFKDEHPANRPAETGDPMGMTAESAPGDPELMLTILVEEYASLGMNADEIMRIFDDPFYGATANLKRLLGEDRIRTRINEVVQNCGALRVSVRS